MLWLHCIWTTTSCDRGKDFRPDRRYFLARSCGSRLTCSTDHRGHREAAGTIQIPSPGVLGRGRERTSHPRARSLSARPMCPASLPPTSCHPRRSGITGTVEALLREVRVHIGHKGLQPLLTAPHEPRNHAVLSDALSTRCRLCIRFGHSPPLQGPLHARNHTGGRSPASPLPTLTQIRTGHPTSPRHPVRLVDRHGVVGLARHRPTR